ncbi:hypothetical protein [Salinispira pacifica]
MVDMNAYLVFALVATLELVSPGTTRFGVDVIRGGVLESQFSISTESSLSRFVRTAMPGSDSESGPFMQVERSSAFGHVYTVVPGAAMRADAAAAAKVEAGRAASAASGAASGQTSSTTTSTTGAGTTAASPAGGAAGSGQRGGTAQPTTAPPPVPPVAFSLAGFLEKLQSPRRTANQRFTIDDPVAALLAAFGGAPGSAGPANNTGSPMATAAPAAAGTSAVTSAGNPMTAEKPTGAVSGQPSGAVSGQPSGQSSPSLSISVNSRGDLTYLELPDAGLVLVVRPAPTAQ